MYIIAYDLGTGGAKASLFDMELRQQASCFVEYATEYPGPGRHEQSPEDWWKAIVKSTQYLLGKSRVSAESIQGICLSGHSLVSVPIDKNGNRLLDRVPIWSDIRAEEEARAFFQQISEEQWYMQTGNGFPPACYPIFKLMWMKKHQRETYEKTKVFLGSKDYINFRLTGKMVTDVSYASGSGAWILKEKQFSEEILAAADLDGEKFPPVMLPHTVIGTVTRQAADETGLCAGTAVICGGVDNACMALGAVGAEEGKCYVSLGSSAWIPVNTAEPILDWENRAYTFAHLEENLYTSAFSVFAAGSSLRWVRDTICADFSNQTNAYQRMDSLAFRAEAGAGGVLFHPGLAGSASDENRALHRGAFVGLSLGTGREELIRAAMEGITANLYLAFKKLQRHTSITTPLLFCGGGSKSDFWLQIFADMFEIEVLKTGLDQEAASLGAAAVALRALGIWKDYAKITDLHDTEKVFYPNEKRKKIYRPLVEKFVYMERTLCKLGENSIMNK